MWWKIFSAVLAAGLTAGLIVFLVWRADIKADREAQEWNPKAEKIANDLSYIASAFAAGDPQVQGDESNPLSLKWNLHLAENWLSVAPARGNKHNLERAIKYAHEELAKK